MYHTKTFLVLLVSLIVVNLYVTESKITLQDNGYSVVLVAISEDEPLPSDGEQNLSTIFRFFFSIKKNKGLKKDL